jgi:hypothetical protein
MTTAAANCPASLSYNIAYQKLASHIFEYLFNSLIIPSWYSQRGRWGELDGVRRVFSGSSNVSNAPTL